MEKTIKQAKRRSTWRTVLITIIVLAVTVIGGSMVNKAVTRFMQSQAQVSFDTLQQVIGANEFIGTKSNYPGLLGGQTQYKTFKYIEGKVVPTGEGAYGYGFLRDEVIFEGSSSPVVFGSISSEMDLDYQRYNEFGQREMLFFYPFLQYKEVRNDLALLAEIGDDKIMEVALSFEKGYTMQEALAKLPNEITTTWLWVKDVDEEADTTGKRLNEDGEVVGSFNLLRSEHTVYGFSLLTFNGDLAEEPAIQFLRAIGSGKRQKTSLQDEYERLDKVIGGEDGLALNDIVIYGAVVTGNKETLASLQNLDFIKASSIGVITDKY